DADFKPEYLDWVAEKRGEDYYLKMMVAWYFATALAKQYDATLPLIEIRRLEPWTHNKAIQKAVESFRVTDEHKAYLRTLRV
ncbi:MAG: DNA alkylation repair protein, partial [Treponemataceae bacterium]|nr:DNA alkylation repair protein [Treponemataceae bacterium]